MTDYEKLSLKLLSVIANGLALALSPARTNPSTQAEVEGLIADWLKEVRRVIAATADPREAN